MNSFSLHLSLEIINNSEHRKMHVEVHHQIVGFNWDFSGYTTNNPNDNGNFEIKLNRTV